MGGQIEQTDETSDRQNLVAASIAYPLYCKPFRQVLKNLGTMARTQALNLATRQFTSNPFGLGYARRFE